MLVLATSITPILKVEATCKLVKAALLANEDAMIAEESRELALIDEMLD